MRFWFSILFLVVFYPSFGWAEEVTFVLSANLRPYLEVVEGYKSSCGRNFKVFKVDDVSVDDLKASKVVVAVGVSAFSYVRRCKVEAFKIYSLLIYPVSDSEFSCGLYLHPPPERILRFLERWKIRRVAVFYSVSDSGQYVLRAVKKARKKGIIILPVKLENLSVDEALSKIRNKAELLWIIPDPAVASESVVSFIIKKALAYRIPVMGYNSFFCDEGALFCLNIDYFETGKRLCSMVKGIIKYGTCEDRSAVFKIEVNKDAYRYFYGETDDGKK